MKTTKSWIAAVLLLSVLLAACAAQPIQTPTPGASGGPSGSYTGPAERTVEASGEPVSAPQGGGNGSDQTAVPSPVPTQDLANSGQAGATPVITLSPSPVPTLDPGSSSQADATPVLTLENSGETLTLKQGQSFLLKLGEVYDWQIIIADQSVISRVKNVMVIRGAQGLYTALQPGQTEFSAQGDPLCRQQKPACGMPSVLFRQTIIVQ